MRTAAGSLTLQDTMYDDAARAIAIEHLDPSKRGPVTESGELERTRVRRKIDCAGNPEITDRRRVARGAPEPRSDPGAGQR